ncbi:tetratricopeptide repeat protein [Chitiniphilus eburneus]|uniref:Sel1 repeat family protein n=1 Tax=Chitiniphilus eburneus TaxID=2571148 RepID=A0A4U0P8K4_9NEIS|nr:SEL1-like repeat protein [Chitiniphilus eburneus]TJZ63866.1 sel1 repeat family protein [Chitiniphilus eburneus]
MKEKDYFSLGDKYFDSGLLRKAFLTVKAGAYKGDTSCQQNLGYFYDEGVGTFVNKEKAIYWYRKSARLGECSSALNLGILYRDRGLFFWQKNGFFMQRI